MKKLPFNTDDQKSNNSDDCFADHNGEHIFQVRLTQSELGDIVRDANLSGNSINSQIAMDAAHNSRARLESKEEDFKVLKCPDCGMDVYTLSNYRSQLYMEKARLGQLRGQSDPTYNIKRARDTIEKLLHCSQQKKMLKIYLEN